MAAWARPSAPFFWVCLLVPVTGRPEVPAALFPTSRPCSPVPAVLATATRPSPILLDVMLSILRWIQFLYFLGSQQTLVGGTGCKPLVDQ